MPALRAATAGGGPAFAARRSRGRRDSARWWNGCVVLAVIEKSGKLINPPCQAAALICASKPVMIRIQICGGFGATMYSGATAFVRLAHSGGLFALSRSACSSGDMLRPASAAPSMKSPYCWLRLMSQRNSSAARRVDTLWRRSLPSPDDRARQSRCAAGWSGAAVLDHFPARATACLSGRLVIGAELKKTLLAASAFPQGGLTVCYGYGVTRCCRNAPQCAIISAGFDLRRRCLYVSGNAHMLRPVNDFLPWRHLCANNMQMLYHRTAKAVTTNEEGVPEIRAGKGAPLHRLGHRGCHRGASLSPASRWLWLFMIFTALGVA